MLPILPPILSQGPTSQNCRVIDEPAFGGKGVLASRDIKRGELILAEAPTLKYVFRSDDCPPLPAPEACEASAADVLLGSGGEK